MGIKWKDGSDDNNIVLAKIKKQHYEDIVKQMEDNHMPDMISKLDVIAMLFAEYEGCIDGLVKYANEHPEYRCEVIIKHIKYKDIIKKRK